MLYQKISIILSILCFVLYTQAQPTPISPVNEAMDISKTVALEWTGNADAYAIEIYACTPDDINVGSLDLNNFELAEEVVTITEIYGDLSGLTYNPLTGTFFGPSNGIPMIFEIDTDGSHIRTINLNDFQDTEGLVWIGGNDYFVIEERKGRAVKITIEAGTTVIDYPMEYIQLSGDWGNNLGLEGVAYNEGTLYLLKEKSPAALYVVEIPDNLPQTITPAYLFDINSNNFGCSDFSGMHYHPNGHLLLLSHEAQTLIETDMTGDEISRLHLGKSGAGGTLWEGILQAEGVSVDNQGNMYVVSEPNTFYKFSNPMPALPFDSTALTFSTGAVSADSYSIPAGTLLSNSTYCWRIKNNTTDEWSEFWSFTTAANVAPTINLTAPSGSMIFTNLNPFNIIANANDADGEISHIKFFINNDSVGIDMTSPYAFSFTPPDYATYQIHAQATDNESATTISATVSVEVTDMTAQDSPQNIRNFQLLTNPLTDSLILSFETIKPTQNAQILIYDTTGKKVMTQPVSDSNTQHILIDISTLPTGIYILTLDTTSDLVSRTFIKR